MNTKNLLQYATAVSMALALSTAYAADTTKPASTDASTTAPMTGKEKATAIGATSGAVAGAVVGGPVGAVVGAGIGAYVGNQGTDANGKVATTRAPDGTVRNAQVALNEKGYDVGKVDGQFGPSTQSAVRRFQSEKGLAQSGRLDSATLVALGVNG
jgi:peptidoglycan hydrolase-like protein with peptidoglycan-binding domain